jgi:hypothetical protein
MVLNDIIKFDKYFWIARFFPALIVSLPFFVFQYVYLDNLFLNQLKLLENYSIILHSFIVILIIYLASILVGGFGKELIEKIYFIRNNKFPTIQFLLGNKEMSNQQLNNLKNKIKKDFKIDLQQRCNQKEKLLRIKDSVNQIIAKVGYDNKILNQYNLEYGFFRNITGGLIIFFITDLLLLGFSFLYKNSLISILSLSLLAIGLIYLAFSWYILDCYGTKYAGKLFNEYLKQ